MPKIGILDKLTEEQQDQVLSWMELLPIGEVIDCIAADPPEGFGIRTHVTSLRRFKQKAYRKELDLALENVRNDQLPPEQRRDLEAATRAALLQQAHQIASSGEADPARLRTALALISSLQELDHRAREIEMRAQTLALNRERLEMGRQKFRFEAAVKEACSPHTYAEEKNTQSSRGNPWFINSTPKVIWEDGIPP